MIMDNIPEDLAGEKCPRVGKKLRLRNIRIAHYFV